MDRGVVDTGARVIGQPGLGELGGGDDPLSITMWIARLLSMRPSISSRNERRVIELLRAMSVTVTVHRARSTSDGVAEVSPAGTGLH